MKPGPDEWAEFSIRDKRLLLEKRDSLLQV
jgi:hypothetical protein